MKKQSLVLLIFLCGLTSISLKAQPFTGSLLWEVSGNGLQQPSYVFGTHHLISDNFLDSVPHLWEKYAICQQVIGEMHLDEIANAPAVLQAQMLLPENESYENFLTPEEYATLDTLLINNLGAGLGQSLAKIRPSVLALMVTQMTFTQIMNINLAEHKPIDVIFQEKALQENKSIIGLETAQEQLSILLNTSSNHSQAMAIICLLEHKSELVSEVLLLNKLYKDADFEKFMALSENSICATSKEEMDIINKDRNDLWIKQLPTMISETPSFIAVGCLHLVGEDGILRQLHNLGYKIKAVR